MISCFALSLLVCGLFLYLVNLNPLYVAEALLDASKSQVHRPANGSLRGLDRSVRRIIWANYRISHASSNLNFAQKMAILKSDDLMMGFIDKYQLKPKFFPGLWDDKNKQWKKKQSWFKRLIKSLNDESPPVTNEPANFRAIKLLSKRLKLRVDKQTNLVSVQFTWKIPIEGKQILDSFIAYSNDYILNREKESIQKSIESLEDLMSEKRINIKSALIDTRIQLETRAAMINPVLSSPFAVVMPTKVPAIPKFRFPAIATCLIFIVCFTTAYLSIIFSRQRKIQEHKKDQDI